MKTYTCRKRNEAGQKAINCIHYNCDTLNITCGRDLQNYCTCIVRLGKVCNKFEGKLV